MPASEQRLLNVTYTVVEIFFDDDDLFRVEPTYQGLKVEQDLVQRLSAQTQYPIDGAFQEEDLQWTLLVTFGGGRYNKNVIVVIPWSRLEDFNEGKQSDPLYTYKFTREILRRNKSNSLIDPQESTPALEIRYALRYLKNIL